jgi:hypothetical protein
MDLPRHRFRNKPPKPNRIVARKTPSSLPGGGRKEADEVVVTVSSVELVLPVPSGVTVVGLKLQVAPIGNPEHWKPTAWLKPPTESTLSAWLTELPRFTTKTPKSASWIENAGVDTMTVAGANELDGKK